MKIEHYSNIEGKSFSGEQVRGVTGRVLIGRADGAGNFCMRMFELSAGGFTPRHSHEWEHEIFFHKGEGLVLRDGEWVPVQAGTIAFVGPNEEHQIKNAGEGPLTFVCLIPSGYPEL